MNYETKDSGKRQSYESGMVRDTQEDKPDLFQWMPKSIPYTESLWYRAGMLANRGAVKYGRRNWELAGENPASADEEEERFASSLIRHAMQAAHGEIDEDHEAAVIFNAICLAMVRTKRKMRQQAKAVEDLSTTIANKQITQHCCDCGGCPDIEGCAAARDNNECCCCGGTLGTNEA